MQKGQEIKSVSSRQCPVSSGLAHQTFQGVAVTAAAPFSFDCEVRGWETRATHWHRHRVDRDIMGVRGREMIFCIYSPNPARIRDVRTNP